MRKRLKQIFSAALTGIVMCTAITFYPVEAKAAADETAKNVWDGVSSADWMSGIDGSTKLSAINIPGTHDSTTKTVKDTTYSKCQNTTITEQLELGIRYLDMRFDGSKSETGKQQLICVHAGQSCYSYKNSSNLLDFQEVLDDCYAFLNKHPTETIVMRMKEDEGKLGDKEIQTRIHNYIKKNSGYWYVENRTPTLDEVRGKIVLARYYMQGWAEPTATAGLNFSGWKSDENGSAPNPPWVDSSATKDKESFDAKLFVQDSYKLDANTKWSAAESCLNQAKKIENPSSTYFLTYLSSAGPAGTFGIPKTTPSAIANSVNKSFSGYTMEYGANYGWIVMDFATEQLSKHVYTSNKSPKVEAITATIDALSMPATVESDILLPTTGEAVGGAVKTSIQWSCNPASALSETNGKYTLVRQPSSDANVTLTATVSSGNCSKQKTFQVQVSKLPEKFTELNTAIAEAEAILSDPAKEIYDMSSLEAAVEAARALLQSDDAKVSQTQIGVAMETLTAMKNQEFVLKDTKGLKEQLKEHLLAWYPLTGNSNDVSGNRNNGIATGVTFDKTNGARFTGEKALGSYIKLPTAMFNRTEDNNNLTFSFWIKDDRGSGGFHNAFGFGNGTECNPNNGGSKHFIVNTNDSGNLVVNACPKGWQGNTNNIKTPAPAVGAWTHLTVVMKGKQMSLYQNGKEVKTITADYSLAEMDRVAFAYIGNAIYGHNSDTDFKGNIKDFRVYDCAITPEQAAVIYNDKDTADTSASSEHLLAHYPLTTDSKDVSGNYYDAKATGVTFSEENGAAFAGGAALTSYISIPTNVFDQILGNDKMTVSFWIKDERQGPCNVFGFSNSTDCYTAKHFLVNTNGRLLVNLCPAGWSDNPNSIETDAAANTWFHLTIVMDGKTMSLYKNGEKVKTITEDYFLSDMGNVNFAYIGNCLYAHNPWTPDENFKGNIKDFRIYDCAMSETEATGFMKESVQEELMVDLESSLNWDITKGEDGRLSMSVTSSSLTLPTTACNGTATISWESSNENIINSKTGAVTLPGVSEPIASVTLTATVTINGQAIPITFHCEVFTKLDIDTADLQVVVSSEEILMSRLNETDYTASSWKAFQDALAAAKQQIKKPTSEEAVALAAADLQEKKTALVELGDKTDLNALINTVKSLKEAEYTTATWTEFKTVLTAAEEAAKSNDVSQADVNMAKNNLSEKKDALVKRGDKTKLNAAIAEAEAYDQEDYTTDTWTSFRNTLIDVQGTADDIDATEADVKEAEESLDSAVKALKKITYTVTFKPDNGSDDITEMVERKDKVPAPQEPEKEGYIFDGWFEADAEEAFDVENTPIMSNVTLTAKWAVKRTVTFNPDNDTPTFTQFVKDGGKATKPDTPEKEGHGFVYWYVEGEDTEFDFANTPITENITLTAKWVEGHTVTFNPDNESESWTVPVEDGGKVAMPETAPEKEGYEFEYWYEEDEDSEFDFANTSITADITLTAKWKEILGNVATLKPNVTQQGTGSINVDVDAGSIELGEKTEVAIDIPDSIAENIKNCEGTEVSINVNIPDGMKNNENIYLTAITLPKEALEAAGSADKDLIITVNGDSSYQWVFTAEELKSATITDVNLLVEKDGDKAAEVKSKLNTDEEGVVFSFVQAVPGSVSVDTEGMKWKAGDAVNLSYYNSETKRLEPVSGTYQVGANGKVTIKVPKAGSYVLWRKAAVNEGPKIIKVKTLKINAKKLTLGGGEKFTLKLTISPSNATNRKVTWTSSNNKAATVNNKGVVEAKKVKKPAKTTITAKVDGKTIQCTVNVKPAPKKIALNAKSKTLKKGKTFQVKVKYTPKNAASYKLTYSVDKKGKKVVSVDSKGKIKAKKKGKATITVTTYNKKKATIKITVK